jgi:hypothetical protein
MFLRDYRDYLRVYTASQKNNIVISFLICSLFNDRVHVVHVDEGDYVCELLPSTSLLFSTQVICEYAEP